MLTKLMNHSLPSWSSSRIVMSWCVATTTIRYHPICPRFLITKYSCITH